MQMAEGLDTGDCIDQVTVSIGDDETGGSLFEKLMKAGAEQLVLTMDRIGRGEAVWTPQPEESPTPYAKMLTRATGLVDWTRSAAEIERMIRALDPWPGTYTFLNGKMLKLWKAEVAGSISSEEECGTIVDILADAVDVQTGDGILRLLELQPEGKKRMSTDAYIRGYHPEKGTVLG